MKKRYMALLVCAISLLSCLSLACCKSAPPTSEDAVVEKPKDNFAAGELVGMFDTEQQALEAAKLYDVKLKDFSYGTAVFSTDKDLDELLALGKENGWPELSKNYVYTIN